MLPVSDDGDSPRFENWDKVRIVSGEYFFEKDGEPSEELVDGTETLEVVSSEYDGRSGWLYNLRNAEGWRVWHVGGDDLYIAR